MLLHLLSNHYDFFIVLSGMLYPEITNHDIINIYQPIIYLLESQSQAPSSPRSPLLQRTTAQTRYQYLIDLITHHELDITIDDLETESPAPRGISKESLNLYIKECERPTTFECPICLSDETQNQNQDLREIRKCGHIYCQACIERWLEMNATCPKCRIHLFSIDNSNGTGGGST